MQEEHLVKGPWYFNLHVCEKITLLRPSLHFCVLYKQDIVVNLYFV